MINVLRAEQDFVGQRFTLAAANKVLVVSEPLNDSAPFIPGKHLIVTPLDRMADTVCEMLRDEQRRSRLADQAHDFVTRELTIGNMMGALLNEVARVRQTT
jgi:glycosyltransferase involved in cell wall biosynthesis